MKIENKIDILLREYSEAGALCRSYEQHARTSLAVFVPFATALVAYTFGTTATTLANIILSGVGLVFSGITLSNLYRVREFNHIANKRAAEIETLLHMNLYRRLNARFADKWVTPKNKIAFMWVVGIFMLIFIVRLIWSLLCFLQ